MLVLVIWIGEVSCTSRMYVMLLMGKSLSQLRIGRRESATRDNRTYGSRSERTNALHLWHGEPQVPNAHGLHNISSHLKPEANLLTHNLLNQGSHFAFWESMQQESHGVGE